MAGKILFAICIIITFAIGLGVGIFAGPYFLFGGRGHFPAGGFQNRSGTNAPSTEHLQYAVDIANKTGIGQYLVNSTGWALYMYVPDTPNSGKSTCYGQCAIAWPIFYTSNLTVQPGINASKFGVINRTDGTKQLTYNGYPLYYYEYDTGAGNLNGQGNDNIWYVLSPSGAVIYNNT